jgi:hypothetical protein
MSNTLTYTSWLNLKQRAVNPNHPRSKDYSVRGIDVCERWLLSFEAFLEDVGIAPEGCSIERRDNSKGYTPENCYWATAVEQNNNRRSNHLMSLNGKTQTMAMWAKELHLSYTTIRRRVNGLGWSDERALTTPIRSIRSR